MKLENFSVKDTGFVKEYSRIRRHKDEIKKKV